LQSLPKTGRRNVVEHLNREVELMAIVYNRDEGTNEVVVWLEWRFAVRNCPRLISECYHSGLVLSTQKTVDHNVNIEPIRDHP